MMQWLLANIFFACVASIFGALMFFLGFSMRFFGLEPDQNPLILSIGMLFVLVLAYYTSKGFHIVLQRIVR